jgi:(4S)-4-hydroxy-5-phosphonooxypentane-2,3-dione isomerase
MFVVCVEFEIALQHLDGFLLAIRKNARLSLRDEEDCQQFDICQDQQNPTSIFLYETYGDAAGFERHKAAPHYDEFNEAIDGMVLKKAVRLFTIISQNGISQNSISEND